MNSRIFINSNIGTTEDEINVLQSAIIAGRDASTFKKTIVSKTEDLPREIKDLINIKKRWRSSRLGVEREVMLVK